MSFRLKREESVAEGVRRIAVKQIGKALADIDDRELDRHMTVHQVRKRCKMLRALVRLVRPSFPDYSKANALYRDAARELSYIRDAGAVVETVDDLLERFDKAIEPKRFRGIRDELVARRDALNADHGAMDQQIAQVRETLAGSLPDAASWTLKAEGGRAVSGGAKKTYKRARDAMAGAKDEPSTAAFHEWRKRVKYHWHHAQLLSGCWPKLIKPWGKQAHVLANQLGDEHDLAVLHGLLLEEPDRFANRETLQVFTGLIERRRAELRPVAFQLGNFLLFEKPKQFEKRVQTYFETWRKPIEALSQPAPRGIEE